MRLILAALLAGSCFFATAQKKPPAAKPHAAAAPTSWPIESVQIEGLHEYTREQVLAVLNLKPGQHAAAKDFEDARQRLGATGAFESVGFRYAPGPNGKGYAVTYEVTEAGPRFPVRFEDLGVPDTDVTAALHRHDAFFTTTIPATQPLLERYSKAIEAMLAARGKTAKVAGRLEPDDAGKLAVVFRIPGSVPSVSRVNFSGNSVILAPVLENAINGIAIGVPYKEPRFRQLLDSQVRPLYDARGRVRVSFPEVHTEPDKDVKGVVVSVKIDEGPSFTLRNVELQGTGLAPADMKKALAEFKSGEVFNREAIEAGVAKLDSRMRRLGFMQVKSNVERKIDDKAKQVDVVVHVAPGPRYTFGQLTIEGLDIISEPAIRKMWGIKPGEPFNSEYPDHFLGEIREEGVLDNLGETKSVLKTNDEDRTVDVTLYFKGAPPKPKKRPGFPDEPPPDGTPGPFLGR